MRLAGPMLALACLAAPATACQIDPWRSPDARASLASDLQPGADITRAWYAGPTAIYDHGILGDAIEAGFLHVTGDLATPTSCNDTAIAAGDGHVFEDTTARLADLDGDGRNEVIAVRTSLTQGAQLAIYGLRDGELTLLATTPYIGQTHRWLAPIGVGDIDGDGRVEVAYIDRPHLARVMRVWRFDGAGLTEAYKVAGLTNHRIGDPAISGGFRTCDGVTEAVTASPDWSRIMATRIDEGRALMHDLGPNTGPDAFADAMACQR